jgi:amino acid transporter
MNTYTKTPVNAVWFDAILAIVLGLLVFAGNQAINAIFSMSVTAIYIAYATPIVVRYTGGNDFVPGPFNLGIFVCAIVFGIDSSRLTHSSSQSLPVAITAVTFMLFLGIVFLFPGTPHAGAKAMNYSVVVTGGIMILSLLWYYFPKYGGVHWFKGPVPNIDLDVKPSDDYSAPSEIGIDESRLDVVGVQRE